MRDQQQSLRALLLIRADELKNIMNDFMSCGKEFQEVKKIYEEFKEVVAQLDGIDRRARLSGLRDAKN